MKKLFIHPFFLLGLMLRVVLIIALSPLPIANWYAPFLDIGTSVLTVDPWSVWMNQGGDLVAFPYGYAMWLPFLPFVFAAKVIGAPLEYAYDFTLLCADFCLLLTLRKLLPNQQKLILLAYWLSPIIIVASYGFGLNDLIPALFLVLSMLCVRRVDLRWGGALLAVAISAKLSMIVAAPFFAIYLIHNRALRQRALEFAGGFSLAVLVLGGAFVFSSAGMQMLLNNPEMEKIYQLAVGLAGNVYIFIVPLTYLLVLYLTWRVRRLNFELFQATIGMSFLLVVVLTPSSPGWFVWCIPFLVLYQAMSGRIAVLLVGAFSVVYVASALLLTPLHFSNGNKFALASLFPITAPLSGHAASLLYTMMAAIGGILAIRIWRETISRNDFFRLSRNPFVVGIAGDSGAGKDTFADAISALFGDHSTVKLSGDDYHLWDRQRPMWQVMTHLNPMANDLEGFCNDLVSLSDGKNILLRHYDHKTGKMSRPFVLHSNDFIIASGLHALYLRALRDCYNLKIYLEIDEGLRRYFKIRRDVHQRGHTLDKVLGSFKKREPDSEQFIRPQSKHADLVLSLQPIHPGMLEGVDDKHPLRLKLIVNTRNGFNELTIHRILVGVCGLHVDVVMSDDGSDVQLTIEGETSAEDVAMAAEILCPRVRDFLDISPIWQDGMLGLMQLITLTHINQALTTRFIK